MFWRDRHERCCKKRKLGAMTELESCPYCHSRMTIELTQTSVCNINIRSWLIRCTACQYALRLSANGLYGRPYYKTKNEAIEYFNRLVIADRNKQLREKR